MRLQFASLLTLGLMLAMLFTVITAFAYYFDFVSWDILLFLPPLLTVLMWLISPTISDWMYSWLYKLKWISLSELRTEHPQAAEFITATASKYRMPAPKVGVIPDDNPTAFCYGSHRGNSRLVVTKGLFRYLDEDEVTAVVAHEMGHIVHRDFIVMTVATIIVQLLYEAYVITRGASRSRGGRKGKGGVAALMIVSYVFYFISTYLLLYLSRVREYYADEFSARETHKPNALMNALIKVAYGIVAEKDSESSHRLMGSTRALGLVDYKSSKEIGVTYAGQKGADSTSSARAFEHIFLFDLKNPWAMLLELSSTHPLTAKRIDALEDIAVEFMQTPSYRMEQVKSIPVDVGRMWMNFLMDVGFLYLPKILLIGGVVMLFLDGFGVFFGLAVLLYGIALLAQTFYRYPSSPPQRMTILDAVSDPYASPIRGKPIEISGQVVGRGVPGLIYSEDMMMQDGTGLIYLNYESLIPIIGNFLFGWDRVNKLIGKPVRARGWFMRHLATRIELDSIVNGESVKSHVRTWSLIFGALATVVGLLLAAPLLLLLL